MWPVKQFWHDAAAPPLPHFSLFRLSVFALCVCHQARGGQPFYIVFRLIDRIISVNVVKCAVDGEIYGGNCSFLRIHLQIEYLTTMQNIIFNLRG